MEKYYLLIFNNTHGAIKAEGYLKSQGVNQRIMPTPTYITHSCGISIRFGEEEIDRVKEFIQEGKLEIKGLYVKEGGEFKQL
jgi:hypothetical protein